MPTLLLPLLLLLLAAPLAGQTVSGVLRQEGSGAPVEGAVVSLLDGAGAQRVGTLTDAAGRFRLAAPAPGRYRLRAERIGYASTLSAPLQLAAGEHREQELVASAAAIELTGIEVRAERRCTVRPEAGVEAARLWDEARKALNAVALTEEQGLARYRLRRYSRDMDVRTLRVHREETQTSSRYGEKPFVSRPARELVDSGYVRAAGEERIYYAPDAGVLLSDDFLDTHCFGVRRAGAEAPHLVGLSFEPLRGRRLPDVEGVLWLDERTAELRHVEFTYTGLPRTDDGARGRGRVEYRRLPTGAWVVDRWWIRMPLLARESGAGRVFAAALREEGGAVEEAVALGGARLATAEHASLAGTVHDSIAGAPLAGARVYLDGTSYAAQTDSAGRFRLEELPEGTYSVGFTHPRLTELGLLLPPRPLALRRGATAQAELALPSLTTWLALACGDSARPPGRAVLVGVVRDAATGTPLPGARVVMDATAPGSAPRSLATRTDGQGHYRFCRAPAGAVAVRAELLQRGGPETSARLGPERPARLDLALSLAATATVAVAAEPGRGGTVVVGRVLDAATSAPIPGALVSLGGADQGTLTDRDGAFRIPAPRSGESTIAVRHLGYRSEPHPIEVGAGTTRVEIRVAPAAVELEGIAVTVRAEAEAPDLARSTARHAVGGAELRDMGRRGTRLADAVVARFPVRRRIFYPPTPGACIEGGRGASTIANQNVQESTGGGCDMIDVYLDGAFIADPGTLLRDMLLDDVERLEYLTPLEAGARYGAGRGSGVLLIYSRKK